MPPIVRLKTPFFGIVAIIYFFHPLGKVSDSQDFRINESSGFSETADVAMNNFARISLNPAASLCLTVLMNCIEKHSPLRPNAHHYFQAYYKECHVDHLSSRC